MLDIDSTTNCGMKRFYKIISKYKRKDGASTPTDVIKSASQLIYNPFEQHLRSILNNSFATRTHKHEEFFLVI